MNTALLKFTCDLAKTQTAFRFATKAEAANNYPELIQKCFGLETVNYLDRFRPAVEAERDGTREAELLWMALVSSLRVVSEAGTAPWQYLPPGRRKTVPPAPEVANRCVTFKSISRFIWP